MLFHDPIEDLRQLKLKSNDQNLDKKYTQAIKRGISYYKRCVLSIEYYMSENPKAFARIVSQIYTFLGDLNRYLITGNETKEKSNNFSKISKNFYIMAYRAYPFNSNPLSYLGNLYITSVIFFQIIFIALHVNHDVRLPRNFGRKVHQQLTPPELTTIERFKSKMKRLR